MAAKHIGFIHFTLSIYSFLQVGFNFLDVRSQTGSTKLEVLEDSFDEIAVSGGVVRQVERVQDE